MLIISQIKSEAEIKAVQDLIREFTTWAFTLEEGVNDAPTFENLEKELASLPGIFSPPSGRFLLAKQDNQPAGCVALYGHDSTTCELKRMFVRSIFRGNNIGTKLVKALMEEARQAEYKRIILDSHISMKSAHKIYQVHGFKFVRAPEDFPEKYKQSIVFMECDLS